MPIEFKFDWLAAVLLLTSFALFYFLFQPGKKWFLFLRGIVYAAILGLALEPTLTHRPGVSSKIKLAVLLDSSASMGIEDPHSRIETAKNILQNSQKELEDSFDLSYYQFSQSSSKLNFKELLRATASGASTDLLGSVQQISREMKGGTAGILLFSDGVQTAANSAMDAMPGIPIYSVGLGKSEGIKDIALTEARVSDFAFKNHAVECVLKVSQFGFNKRTLPVLLKERKTRETELISSKNLVIEGPETEIIFRFVPSSIGTLEYRLEIPVQEGEIAKKNNTLDFQLVVGREKIRVLYLCGQPNPEYAFLRQILKSDPSIELVSFVILRNPENVVPFSEEQLSLIPFPHDIFVKSLSEFDLLIFENFAYQRFGILPSHLENIQRFVEERGGGFLMIGGENSFGRGGYAGTAIERILPVPLSPQTETMENQPISLRILEERHPIFEIGQTLSETQKLWKEMPPLYGYHKLTGIKPNALLLAAVAESGLPAITAWQRGKGRVMAVSTISTWQWAMALLERGISQNHYVQFWRQIIRWLISSTEEKPLRIVFSEPSWMVGKKGSVKVVLQSDKLRNLKSPEIFLTVTDPYKNSQQLSLFASKKFEWRAEWSPKIEGEHIFTASVKEERTLAEEKRQLSVDAVDIELENPYPNHNLLKELAEKSGGDFFPAAEFTSDKLKNKIVKVEKNSEPEVQKALWTNPWLVLLPSLILLFEWGLRRYRGGI